MASRYQQYHEKFAARIVKQLEAGTAPWQQPWAAVDPAYTVPTNIHTGKAYRGGNSMFLALAAMERGYGDNRWATYRQIKNAGGQVRRGESGEMIMFFTRQSRKLVRDGRGRPALDSRGRKQYATGRTDSAVMRTYFVYNAEQADGIEPQPAPEFGNDWARHELGDGIIAASGVNVVHKASNRAFYNLGKDSITLPLREQFSDADHYYATAMHELAHATGHKTRLDRQLLQDAVAAMFSSTERAKEELRAEISAMMIGRRIGIGHLPQHGASYVESWLKAIKNDAREIYRACADAQKISDYILRPVAASLDTTKTADDRKAA